MAYVAVVAWGSEERYSNGSSPQLSIAFLIVLDAAVNSMVYYWSMALGLF